MNINIHNYQAYFLDYHEGQLSTEQLSELKAFLLDHPELQQELDNYDLIEVSGEVINYSNKSELKKSAIFDDRKDSYFFEQAISYVEGLMDDEQKGSFLKSFEDDEKKVHELELLKKTILKPDISIHFHEKAALKRIQLASVYNRWYYYAAAASVAIILGLAIVYNFNKKTEISTTISINRPVQEKSPKEISFKRIESSTKPINREVIRPVIRKEKSVEKRPESKPKIISSSRQLVAFNSIEPKKSTSIPDYENEIILKPTHQLFQLEINKSDDQYALLKFVTKKAKQLLFPSDNDPLIYKISAWDIAEAGIYGINSMTGSTMKFNKIEKADSTTQIEFESKLFAFSTTLEK